MNCTRGGDATKRADGLERIGKHLWGRCVNCGRLVKVTSWARGLHLCTEDAS